MLGAGDIGRRVIACIGGGAEVTALTSTPSSRAALRHIGARPALADLDKPGSLTRLPRDWDSLLHCAPPPARGAQDTRTRNILRAFDRSRKTDHKRSSLTCGPSRSPAGRRKRTVVYLSTSGVYGDCAGARITEAQPLHPRNARAVRRVDAERALIRHARRGAFRLIILRVPGIYSETRLPLERLRAGTPALAPADDVYTNHIHAADLAALAIAALRRLRKRVRPQVRIYNANDGGDMRMGDYFDLVADTFCLARPPRLPRIEIKQAVSPALLSFMSESRRMDNARIKRELPIHWFAPTVGAGVAAARASAPAAA
ncbi:MAG: NAD(P)-dependent oxidoreductase [Betaproteobacteria bacterium]|nr:NAD(P)-dependent oxidoreductase [Betaproteobacteria bacterium]